MERFKKIFADIKKDKTKSKCQYGLSIASTSFKVNSYEILDHIVLCIRHKGISVS